MLEHYISMSEKKIMHVYKKILFFWDYYCLNHSFILLHPLNLHNLLFLLYKATKYVLGMSQNLSSTIISHSYHITFFHKKKNFLHIFEKMSREWIWIRKTRLIALFLFTTIFMGLWKGLKIKYLLYTTKNLETLEYKKKLHR